MKRTDLEIVIGSWGSYNACNSRACGSNWLTLSDYDTFDEIEQELTKQGFKLNGIDEELFIQDISGLRAKMNWDYVNPKELFETLKESGVLDNDYQYETLDAFLQVKDYSDFEDLVSNHGSNWDSEIHIYQGYSWYDYGVNYIDMCEIKVPRELENFIDYEAYGEYIGSDCAYEFSDGIIEIIEY